MFSFYFSLSLVFLPDILFFVYHAIVAFVFLFFKQCRLELHTESSNTKPELIFMDQIEEVSPDFVPYKNEQCIQIRFRDGIRDGRIILTNPVSIKIEINK